MVWATIATPASSVTEEPLEMAAAGCLDFLDNFVGRFR